MFPRLAYRARQFWNALLSPEKRVTSEAILPYLTTTQLILFRQMQPSEQVHAYQVFQYLEAAGHTDSDLLAAALLHDVGKILSPLSIFDRVIIVLGGRLFPKAARRWGDGMPRGLRRPFVVAACHAEWGADLVEQSGASLRTVELIRYHQSPLIPNPTSRTERLLAVLQAADDEH
jgi:hypothetical protein